mgnify:CR=1 FL=1
MAAITWRNIDAPDLRGVGNLMQQAAAGTTAMGNALQGAFTSWNTEQQRALDYRKEENTNKFLNDLYSQYRTPEALQAAMDSGEIARRSAGFGNEVNHAAIRGAPEKLLADRQQRSVAGMEYQNKLIDNRSAGAISQIQADLYSGDPIRAEAARARISELDPTKQGEVAKMGFTALGEQTKRDQANTKFTWEQAEQEHKASMYGSEKEAAALKPQQIKANINASNASASASNAAAASSRMRTMMSQHEFDNMKKASSAEEALSVAARGWKEMQKAASDEAHKKLTDANIQVPLDAAGKPKWSSLSEDELLSYGHVIGQKLMTTAAAGDTVMKQAALDDVTSKFGFKAANAASKNIEDMFNTGPAKAIGVDAIRDERAIARSDAAAQRLKEEFGGYTTKNQALEVRNGIVKALKDGGYTGKDLNAYATKAMEFYKPIKSADGKLTVWPDLDDMVQIATQNASNYVWPASMTASAILGDPETIKGKLGQRSAANIKALKKLEDSANKAK